jgi:hypothetical protein
LYHLGQDESVYKQNALSTRVWVVDDIRDMRKKGDGAGEMLSAFQDESRGFGFQMTADELAKV